MIAALVLFSPCLRAQGDTGSAVNFSAPSPIVTNCVSACSSPIAPSAVYAMSSGALTPHSDMDRFPYCEMLNASLSRRYSPNEKEPNLQADGPLRVRNRAPELDSAMVRRWEQQFPINMMDAYLAPLKRL